MRSESGNGAVTAALGVAPHKVVAPRPLPSGVVRRHLLDRLDAAVGPLIVVTAGAGYGKSTLLSEWVRTLDRPYAWLDIDAGDNDPVRMIRGVVSSLHSLVHDDDLITIGRDVRPATVDRALAEIEAILQAIDPFVFVIDNVHHVSGPAGSVILDALVDMMPTGAQIVMCGRSEPDARTARRLLAGELEMFDAGDLVFDIEESERFLSQFTDVTDAAVRTAIAEQTGGWPAGLQFAALGLRSVGNDAVPTRDPAIASAQLLTTYFQQEFLRSLSDDERTFLMRTSLLDRLSGDLCDFVLEEVGTEDRLVQLARSGNVFVVPIGRTGVFRYHPLFAELLLGELRRTVPDTEVPLRLRAIEWHERRGEWNASINQALESNGRLDAAPLVFKYLQPLIASGEVASIGRWLEAFEPDIIRTDPLLSLAAAWHSMFTNQPRDMERFLALAESADGDGPLPDGTVNVGIAAAAVRILAGGAGLTQVAVDARRIRDAGAGGGPWRSVAGLMEVVALHHTGRIADVRAALEPIEFETRGFAAAHAVTLAHLGVESLIRREFARANDEISRACHEVERGGLTALAQVALVFCARAWADALSGSLAASQRSSDQAEHLLSAMDTINARAQIHHRLILAEAAILRNDWPSAVRLVDDADNRLWLEPEAVVLRDWTARLTGRCATHRGLARNVDLTPAEHRVLVQLATHRTLADIGEHLYVSRNTVKTHTVSIYRKLDVSGRTEAVERALELGLVDAAPRPVLRAVAGDR